MRSARERQRQRSRRASRLGLPSQAGGCQDPIEDPSIAPESARRAIRATAAVRDAPRRDVALSSMPSSPRPTWGGSASVCPHASALTIALLHSSHVVSSHRLSVCSPPAWAVCNQRSPREEMSPLAADFCGVTAPRSAAVVGSGQGRAGRTARRPRAPPVPTSHAGMRRSATQGVLIVRPHPALRGSLLRGRPGGGAGNAGPVSARVMMT